MYEIELQKLGFETDFYKFVTNEGCDIGPICLDKEKNKDVRRTYFYNLEKNYKICDDFDKEFLLFRKKYV